MDESELVFVYSTFPDGKSARRVARMLLEKRLAACINIHGPITSLYEWQGKYEEGLEFAAFIKTHCARVEEVTNAARPLHPYTVPCFLVLPIERGKADYLDWANAQIASW